jgi:cobalt-zinc-cadmium efflux system protein
LSEIPAGESMERHGSHSGHDHGVTAGSDQRYLGGALALILVFMAVEVVVGLASGSLALITDAGHMLTDAAAIALALVAVRLSARPAKGMFTYGLKRVEILSAQVNGLTLMALVVFFVYEAVRRLVDPPSVQGGPVAATAAVGIVVNLGASWLLSRANRQSLNIEGAFQHVLNDLFAFVATLVAGLVVLLTGFDRADAIASLVVAALMLKAGYGLVRDSARVFLEASPKGLDPAAIETTIATVPGVTDVHELHVWEVTSGFPALSAHVLVDGAQDCHERRAEVEQLLQSRFGITHTTLQVDHRDEAIPVSRLSQRLRPDDPRCDGGAHPGH